MPDDPLVDSWRDVMRQLDHRLVRDYLSRVRRFGRGVGVWGNSTTVGVDVPLGGRIGPMWGHEVRYAKRTGPLGLFGSRIIIKDLDAVEAELRQALDEWLTEQDARQR
ncbi:MAG: hypothetical protein HYX52_09335 [Chloroflexi bacterium]|nr:hypothetical protein [Chloroflexota bacterium]